MCGQPADEGASLEAFAQHFVVEQEAIADLLLEHQIHKTEVVVVVEDVEVLDDALVCDVAACVADDLVPLSNTSMV